MFLHCKSRSLHFASLGLALVRVPSTSSWTPLRRCTEVGGVKPLIKPPANAPEPTSRSLHFASLGLALVRVPSTSSWTPLRRCTEVGGVKPLIKPPASP